MVHTNLLVRSDHVEVFASVLVASKTQTLTERVNPPLLINITPMNSSSSEEQEKLPTLLVQDSTCLVGFRMFLIR